MLTSVRSQYSYEAASARQTLIDTYGWTITDGGQAVAPEFAIQVKTDNTGTSADNEFTLPWIGTYDVDWGDGNTDTSVVDIQTHTYASPGTYDVKVTATTGSIYFNGVGDKSKVIDIKNWGTCIWTSFENAFLGCENLTNITATNAPNLTNVLKMGSMFRDCLNLVSIDVSTWDLTNITSLANGYYYGMFYGCTNLITIDVSNWNTSNVVEMQGLFRLCPNLTTLDVSNWNTISLANARMLFDGCRSLTTLDVSSWNVSSVGTIRNMFANTGITSLDVSNWNSPNLFNMIYWLVGSPISGLIDVSNWDVSNVSSMFFGLTNNNPAQLIIPSLANWNIGNITNWSEFMRGEQGLSTEDYDATLISWAAQTPRLNQSVGFSNSQYTMGGAAEAARNTLINTYGWTITDGGGVFVGLLDTYPNASAAYSLRDLASASVGSAVVRVRRSSDNTEQDFTAVEITDGTLTTFTGANNGFVTTWYDQSGKGNDSAQATAIDTATNWLIKWSCRNIKWKALF